MSIVAAIGQYLVSKVTVRPAIQPESVRKLARAPFFLLTAAPYERRNSEVRSMKVRADDVSKAALAAGAVTVVAMTLLAQRAAAQEPDLIFRKSTVFKLLTPNDKLATYGIDDPLVEGVACHYTVPEKGGLAGAFGLAEQTSDVSLACRQYGPIKIKEKFEQGDVVYRERRSLIFKKMQIVRGCDAKRNVLVYMVYTDKLIDGSPKNSTSTVPIQPWEASSDIVKCADFIAR
jgi:CreA protein